MDITPYLSFDGNCAEAFHFYERALGGKITFLQSYGDSPMSKDVPEDWRARTMHVTLAMGDRTLSGADAPPGQYQKPAGITVAYSLSDVAEAERAFLALSEGGTVQMPLTETFWALRFGMVTDRYGVPWMVNCEKAPV